LDIIIGSEKHMGKGYGTDALLTLIQYLFQFPEIEKIWIAARADNFQAQHAYTKARFVEEKYLPQDQLFNGKRVDFIKYSLLKTDFT
jgi:RimJ/RimL family protein N-acetyltransferase